MSFSSKPKALATLGVYRKLVHILEVYHKKEVVNKQKKKEASSTSVGKH